MHNQIFLIGRLVSDPQINETESGKVAYITLAVTRSYKNLDGIYETDFIPVTLWKGIAENVTDYCKKGDLVGVKGRIEMFPKLGADDFQDGTEIGLIAEKVSFLSSKKED